MNHDRDTGIPEGLSFLRLVWEQEDGYELALPLSMTAFFGVLLLDLEKDIKKRVISAVRSLVEQIGGVTITEIADYYCRVLEDSVAGNELALIADTLPKRMG